MTDLQYEVVCASVCVCETWETAHCAAAMAVLATVAALTRLLSVTHASLRRRYDKRKKKRRGQRKIKQDVTIA